MGGSASINNQISISVFDEDCYAYHVATSVLMQAVSPKSGHHPAKSSAFAVVALARTVRDYTMGEADEGLILNDDNSKRHILGQIEDQVPLLPIKYINIEKGPCVNHSLLLSS